MCLLSALEGTFFVLILILNQHLQLCTACTVWSGEIIRPTRLGSFRLMHDSDRDLIGKPCMIHRQNLYDSVVLTEDTGVIRGLPTDGDQRNTYDSVVFTKDTGVIRGLPIDGDHGKALKLNKLN